MKIRPLIAAMALPVVASVCRAADQRPSAAAMERVVVDLQASHIAANRPSDATFMMLLQRDVRAYLAANGMPAKSVAVEPLRKGATQGGVSYPKYYVWIRATDTAGHHIAGVMRAAAIGRARFEVTDFTPAASIRADPAPLALIYPAALLQAIRRHAAAE